MPSSTISLDTLSSPSPSPSPPPPDTHTSASNQSGGGAGLDSGSELSELTEDEQENDKSKTAREERARPSRRGRKRGGIVPAPMWDWAYKNNKKEPPKPKPEEEEEEEQAGPVKAMEEEEDDEQDQRSQTGESSIPERRGRRSAAKGAAFEEDEDLDVAHDPATAAPSRDSNPNDPDYLSDEEDVEGAADIGDDETHHPDDGGAASREVSDDENAEDDDVDAPPEEEHLDEDEDADENAGVESEDEAEVPSSVPVSAVAPTSAASRQPVEASMKVDTGVDKMEVDAATPGTAQRSPIIAAAAASSIMAGSSVIRAPSPTPSASSAEGSTRKRTPADSRSPTPEVPSDHEKRAPARSRTRARNGRSTRNRTRRKPKTDPVVEPVVDADQAQLEDQDLDGDDADLDNAELELESDLQPAHRAEALDVLATIELKYALLRERLYVEKMENLAWEEALVLQGVHPEMTHLHEELSKRRDKRLELAARRRDYEVVNITKRRRLDEEAVWSWWKYRRDDLQTTMIAETNRKRRKLDRERRALDRPLPVRRIPSPPTEVPVAPTLRELVKGNPFDSAEARRRPLPLSSLAYPNLTMLSPTDIINDLEFLNGQRRAYDSLRPGMMGINPGGLPANGPNIYEQYGAGVGLMDGPPGRLPPQLPFQPGPFQHGPLPNQMMPGYPIPGASSAPRLQHHHSAPPGNVPNLIHSQMLMEQDVGLIRRPGSGAPNANQFPGGPPLPLMRRSISPVPLQPHGTPGNPGSSTLVKSNGWMGIAASTSSSLSGSSKDPRHLPGSRPMEVEGPDRDRDRDRAAEATSPLVSRDLEPRRLPGDAPMDGIEPSPMVKSALTSPMSSLWKEEQTLSSDIARERARASMIPPAQERTAAPFVMAIQRNASPSSRNVPDAFALVVRRAEATKPQGYKTLFPTSESPKKSRKRAHQYAS
ncbi:hypothetical protein EIP86_001603 [Pleurotus ostreatoroseus]|nr:hypothetical protein EIP86_001603 [Pleurotus ostreatoroseus]